MTHDHTPARPPRSPLSKPQSVTALPAKGTTVVIEANEAERAAIARDIDILAVDRLTATFLVAPWRKHGVKVTGEVRGTVRQECVVTLEPVVEEVFETVELTFLPESEIGPVSDEIEIDPEAADPPEALEGNTVDLGAIAAEHLALGLDPYPKAPGVTFDGLIEDDGSADAVTPFAALASLKGKGGGDAGG
ncbi:DUF177 domain-containing protein [Chthonobacter rhizosphaerae]|uniref:DUF177 domain-containing protein n=1 Tax=Chthonobacter rhizosphaerae TaxID=2735553 RepID=UPI0015EF16B1|nr:DUF177 domain-containing protein [Chthonobacter rhizosphaerae]